MRLTLWFCFLGFDSSFVFGWALIVARPNNSISQWSCFWYYRARTWVALRWTIFRGFSWACCSSITWTGSCSLWIYGQHPITKARLLVNTSFLKAIFNIFWKVYQARLQRSGKIVAVKVQRPGVQAAISLDILILRFLAGLVRKAGKFNTDLQV